MSALAALCLVIAGAAIVVPAFAQRESGNPIDDAMPAVVQVIAADVVDGRLVPKSSGSGTIIDASGSILTNHHVLYDAANERAYDLFLIGRYRGPSREADLACAGDPAHGRVDEESDLILIRCTVDMDGRAWQVDDWPTLPLRRLDREEMVPGEQVWVLGYPNVRSGRLHKTSGLVSGWTGEHGGAASRAYLKTDAAITHGNSGGAALDSKGRLIGVPTAMRVTTARDDAHLTAGKVGLIRPLGRASALIAVARSSWRIDPPSDSPPVTQPPDLGVVVSSRVVDVANGAPIQGAVVIAFKPGITAEEMTRDRIAESALAWGHTDEGGVFVLSPRIPRDNRYAVAVLAAGYRPLVEGGVLATERGTPDFFRPWSRLELERQR